MDERKKSIRELEEKKRKTLETLNSFLGSWGETLLSRLDREDSGRFAGELEQYRHALGTVAVFRDRAGTLEAEALRLRELENELDEKDKAAGEKAGELKKLYVRLGEIALQNDGLPDSGGPLKGEAEALKARIAFLEEKLRELEEGKKTNIFSWIGGNAQGALLRGRLSKTRSSLSLLYASAGEDFFAETEREGEGGENLLVSDIAALRQDIADLDESHASLRAERGRLRDSIGVEGNSRNFSPAKKMRELERHIAREQDQLLELCARFGNHLYDLFAGAIEDGNAGEWLQPADINVLARAREMRGEIAGHEAAIEKLEASLRIDEKREAIDKMKRSVLNHRRRIAASENTIAGLEKQIEESTRHIEELMKI
jgi:chromosome segregation ATPase